MHFYTVCAEFYITPLLKGIQFYSEDKSLVLICCCIKILSRKLSGVRIALYISKLDSPQGDRTLQHSYLTDGVLYGN